MRDVDVFEKKHQVGEGTYGSVFVAKDKQSAGIVALKRINTVQEENGFPITALREVKILKALTHKNIVTLKEIVTSKGACYLSYFVGSVCLLLLFVAILFGGLSVSRSSSISARRDVVQTRRNHCLVTITVSLIQSCNSNTSTRRFPCSLNVL
jgi:serine/threonine protein kinase